jgi:hypothetical protein
MDTKIIYTNQIQMAIQSYDFTLMLNTIMPDGSIANHAMVYLSPQHAKGLLKILAENVQTYEELFGPINVEPDSNKVRELQEKGAIQISPGGRQ